MKILNGKVKASIFAILALVTMSASAGHYIGSYYDPYLCFVPARCVNGCYIDHHYSYTPDPVSFYSPRYTGGGCCNSCGGCG